MISIKNCSPEDATDIARAIMMALHLEFDPDETWSRIFMALAERYDSQYSYTNALKAVTEKGEIAGIIVAYDGGRLAELREQFFKQFRKAFGREIGPVANETEPGEWYLDSLAVFPEFRGRGIATTLIKAAIQRAPGGLRPGLLCSKTNPAAARLYENLGFRKVGERPFLGEQMNHYSQL